MAHYSTTSQNLAIVANQKTLTYITTGHHTYPMLFDNNRKMVAYARFQKAAYWLLMLIIFLTYWLSSRQYTGPAYLSDEIGYLTKAAAFAGYPVDMASSWHGGYSLILSPLFIISSDPFVVWQGIMVLNAAIWVCSFMLLFSVLKVLFSDRSFWAIFFAVTVSAAYPAWITMSGYAFSTTAFVFVFMLSIYTLLKSTADRAWAIVPYALLVGFLYWIHPTGLAVIVASGLAIAGYAWRSGRYMVLIAHVLVTTVMIAVYKFGIHVWLSQIMTPENYPAEAHYPSASSVLQSFLNPEVWLAWLILSLGHISYLLIATLGLYFFGIVEVGKRMIPASTGGSNIDTSDLVNTSLVFMVLSLLGVVLLGSLSFSTHVIVDQVRPDIWIYGRYPEVALLPLLGIGLLAPWRLKYATIAASFVLISGSALQLYSNESNTGGPGLLVNIQGFWPQVLFAHENFIFWFIAGAIGIILASVLKKRLFVLLAVPLFGICIINQHFWHKNTLAGHSKPSSLVGFVTSNFQYGQCIGFDTVSPLRASLSQQERRRLYSFYFFNYDIRRMSPDEWLSSCDGPYLTYRADAFTDSPDSKVIAWEVHSGLFLVLKTAQLNDMSIKSLPSHTADLYVDLAGHIADLDIDLTGNGVVPGEDRFSMSAPALMKFSQVGIYKDDNIVTVQDSGYLFYGPYYPLKRGEYYIKLEGKFLDLQGATLDIVSGNGKNKYLDIMLFEYFKPGENSILIPFSIAADVSDIEIRLHVSSDTKLSFKGYSIHLQEKDPI